MSVGHAVRSSRIAVPRTRGVGEGVFGGGAGEVNGEDVLSPSDFAFGLRIQTTATTPRQGTMFCTTSDSEQKAAMRQECSSCASNAEATPPQRLMVRIHWTPAPQSRNRRIQSDAPHNDFPPITRPMISCTQPLADCCQKYPTASRPSFFLSPCRLLSHSAFPSGPHRWTPDSRQLHLRIRPWIDVGWGH